MSIFDFNYQMALSFSSLVDNHYYRLMAFPKSNERQKVISLNVEVEPNSDYKIYKDWNDNDYIIGFIRKSHDVFKVNISGKVETYASFYEEKEDKINSFYSYESSLTRAGDNIKTLSKCLLSKSNYDKCIEAMQLVNKVIEYDLDCKDKSSVAEEVLKEKKGVCKDFAHVLIALLRFNNIPCRYCAGIVKGEGVSHAWVEVYLNTYWYGLDPTYGRLVGDGYIKFSHGRDASDVLINKGSFKGNCKQDLFILSTMKEEQ